MPKVSVLLTTYNRPGMLREAVDSVMGQTFTDFELIILDDNSSDPVQIELLRDLWSHPQIRIYKDNVQPSERHLKVRYAVLANIGLELARGKFITYLCDDDLFLSQRLELMVARLDVGDCDVVYGSQLADRDGKRSPVRTADSILYDAWCRVDHSSVMHTKKAGLAVGGWDENPDYWNVADAMFWRRLTDAEFWFYPVEEFTDVHRFHSGSVSAAGIPA